MNFTACCNQPTSKSCFTKTSPNPHLPPHRNSGLNARIPHSCCFPFPQPIPSKLRCSKKNAIYLPDITPFSAATPKPFITEISNPTPNGCSESNLKKTTSNQAIEAGS